MNIFKDKFKMLFKLHRFYMINPLLLAVLTKILVMYLQALHFLNIQCKYLVGKTTYLKRPKAFHCVTK